MGNNDELGQEISRLRALEYAMQKTGKYVEKIPEE